ncbi:MAG: 50S ribosomal protein L11 methyltransferase [Desulfovibrionaceae bacterium]|nr:50S ribosomal protein L11 methyltransferase [Desulfovibrionaceae bacterium]
MQTTLLKIEFTIDEKLAEEADEFLASKAAHGWEETPLEGGVKITLYLEDHALGRDIAKEFHARFPDAGVTCTEEEPEDWAMAWKDFFNPVTCGDTFKIFPPWLENGDDNGVTHIVIEPKMAFGTGHHPTTSLCLATIGSLSESGVIEPGRTFLDLGTGSGILGIGLAKLGLKGVCLDNDPLAIPCAVENAVANNVADSLELAVGTIESLGKDVRFDLVVANILSGPLIEMAPDILAHLAPGGSLILSGILADKQSDAVASAYARLGLSAPHRYVEGEWICLVWERIGA